MPMGFCFHGPMKNPVQRAVMSATYLIGGVVFGFSAFGSLTILQSRWEPVAPFKYVAFFSSVVLVIAAGVVIGSEKTGRILAIISILGIGTRMVAIALRHDTAVSPIGFSLFFLLLGFSLFFPNKLRLRRT